MAVVLFHTSSSLVPGGFVGVDIFFVISGFLITSIILPPIQDGTFSFRWFYLRRIRRIAPAYFAIVLATLLAGCLLMLPDDLGQLGESAFWSALSVPNVFFWLHLDTGYFAADSRQVPLLHLWSLGVEEQFYLLWPAMLLAGMRIVSGRGTIAFLLVVVAGSFLHAQHASQTDTSYAYYMLPTRAGELGLGALLALAGRKPSFGVPGRPISETLAALGFLLVIGSLFMLDRYSRFPGWNAFIPCFGTVLLIHAGANERCALIALLRWKPVVLIGLMSYSIYLWHWPLLAFLRYYVGDLSPALAAGALVVIFLLSACSYRFIEKPCRNNRLPPGKQFLFLFVLPAALIACAGQLLAARAERFSLVSPEFANKEVERRLLKGTAPAFEYPDNCQLNDFDPDVLADPRCEHGTGEPGQASMLLWGDSHAAHYIGVTGSIAEKSGFRIRNASYSTCPPVWSTENDYGLGEYHSGCGPFRELVHRSVDRFSTVVVAAQWSIHMRDRDFLPDLERTVDEIVGGGKSVVILGEVPVFQNYDRACEIRNLGRKMVDCVSIATRDDEGVTAANRRLQHLAATRQRVYYMDVHDILCRNGRCSPYLGGTPVYFDRFHLSMEGSWRIGQMVAGSSRPLPPPFRPR